MTTTQERAAYARHVYRQRAYGRWQPFANAEPVRAHVRSLMAYGIGAARVATIAGVPASTVNFLLWGDPARGLPPGRKIRPETARKLLAVRPSPALVAPNTRISATGTRRRLQALACLGWSGAALAAKLHGDPSNLAWIASGTQETVTAALARKVAALYGRLWDQRPPEGTKAERISAAKARGHATRQGWAPPLAWDDDELDNPQASPHQWKRSGMHRAADLAADFAELAARHPDRHVAPETIRGQVLDRLGVKRDALDAALARAAEREDADAA